MTVYYEDKATGNKYQIREAERMKKECERIYGDDSAACVSEHYHLRIEDDGCEYTLPILRL